MVNWESQSKTPPQSPEDGHIYCILLIRIAFCHVSETTSLLVLRHYKHLFLFSIIILHVTSSRSCLYLLDIYHFTYTFSHAQTREFQTQLRYYFFKSDNKSNHHHICLFVACFQIIFKFVVDSPTKKPREARFFLSRSIQ